MRLTVRVTGSQCLHLRRTSLHLLLLHLQLLRLALNLPFHAVDFGRKEGCNMGDL